MTAISLAQINLYDPALLPQPERWSARNTAMMLAATLVAMSLWAGFAQLRLAQMQAAGQHLEPDLSNAKSEMVSLTTALAASKPDERLERELERSRKILTARGEVLKFLKSGLAPDALSQADILRAFATRAMPGLWLTGFIVNKDSGQMDISGRTNDPALIPAYASRLGEEKAFAGRTFAALNIAHSSVLRAAEERPANEAKPAVPPDAKPAPVARFHEFKLNSALPEPETGAGAAPTSAPNPTAEALKHVVKDGSK